MQKIPAPQRSFPSQHSPQPSATESEDFAKVFEQALSGLLATMEPRGSPHTKPSHYPGGEFLQRIPAPQRPSSSQHRPQPSAAESKDFAKVFEQALSAFLPAVELRGSPHTAPQSSSSSQHPPQPSATESNDFAKAFEQALSAFLPALEPKSMPGTSSHSQPVPAAVREDPVPHILDFFNRTKQPSPAASKTDQVS